MVDGWIVWVLLVGLAVGAAGTWLLLVRLARDEDDVSADERQAEAAWISATIERDGGVAPESLVEEVLELHQAYLRTPSATPETMLPPPAVQPHPARPHRDVPGAVPGPVPPPGAGRPPAAPVSPQAYGAGGRPAPPGAPPLPPPGTPQAPPPGAPLSPPRSR